MNSQRSLAPMLGIGAALMSLFIIASVLLGKGNNLAMLCRYLLVAGFICGILFPRGTLFVWLAVCGYTDMLKRLMVVFGNVQHSDLFNVLGIPPMMVTGVTLSVLIGALTRRFQLRPSHWKLFWTACLLVLVNGAFAIKETGGSLAAIVGAMANDGTYVMLLFVVPVLFRDTEDLVKIAKVLLFAYVPVALYGVFQQIFGFQPFEIAYLKTGLTLEIKQLYANEVRAFSTMNSPTSFSAVCGILCSLSLIFAFTPQREGAGTVLKRNLALLLAAVYFAGIVASTSRSAMLLVVIASVGFVCFRSRVATRWLYTSLAVAFVGLVTMAGTLLSNLDVVQDKISDIMGEGQLATQLSRVGTFSDRLHGFSNLLTNPEVYTLFGYGPGRSSDDTDPLYAHDLVSNVLVTHGLVPLLAIMIIGGMILRWVHRRVFLLHDRHHRLLGACFVALAFSLMVLSTVSGSVLGTFPVNALFWLCIALMMLVCQSDLLHSAPGVAPSPASDRKTASAQVEVAPRVVHRFRRSGYSPEIRQ